MFNDSIFRVAFAISLSIHLFAISSGGFFNLNKPEDIKEDVEVTYIVQEFPVESFDIDKAIPLIPKNYDLEREPTKLNKNEVSENQSSFNESNNDLTFIDESKSIVDNKEEYIQYYELIREKIRKEAERNSKFSIIGMTEVSFVVRKDGSLKSIAIMNSANRYQDKVEEAASNSVKQASPFPPFPEALKIEELSFQVAIVFKKNK